MSDKEFIERLINVREMCSDYDCVECHYADEYHNCYFTGMPYEWYNLEDMLKQEREDINNE